MQSEREASSQENQPIQIRSITVQTGRIVCDISIEGERFHYSSPKLAAFVAGSYPELPHHACVNELGTTFGDVFEQTSIPHMLEHLAISIQARNDAKATEPFVGTSEWIDEKAGEARVSMSYRDDLEALKACNEATRFLNIAVITCLA